MNYINSKFDVKDQLIIINAKNDKGLTPLMQAADRDEVKIVKLILNYIERFDRFIQLAIINFKDDNGNTALVLSEENYKRLQPTKIYNIRTEAYLYLALLKRCDRFREIVKLLNEAIKRCN